MKSNNLRVLILSENFPKPSAPELGTFVEQQASEIANMSQTTVIAPLIFPLNPKPHYKYIRSESLELSGTSKNGRLNIHRPIYPGLPWHLDRFNVYSSFSACWSSIKKKSINFDVIHSHMSYPSGYVGLLLGRHLKKPVITTLHGGAENILLKTKEFPFYEPLASNLYSSTTKKMFLKTLRYSDLVISNSNDVKEMVLGAGIKPKEIITIGNGVNSRKFSPMPQDYVRDRLNLPQGKKILLFIGTLNKGKNPKILLSVFGKLLKKNQQLLLVFIGDGPYRNGLKIRARKDGIEQFVLFPGSKAHDEIPLWLNAADLFVFPSFYESFGCVLLEALSCGVPVITSNAGAIPEIIQDRIHGFLINPHEPESLRVSIEKALAQDWNRELLSDYAKAYSWQNIAKQIYSQYERVLENFNKAAYQSNAR